MKLAIMQPYFFPYIGYWQLIYAADNFVLYDNIEYSKNSWFNRNNILKNGDKSLFTIPLKKESDKLNVDNRNISNEASNHIKKILRQIKSDYSKAPYFNETFPIIEEIFNYNEINLFKYIYNSISIICKHLEIITKITISSNIDIDHTLKSQEKVLAINKELNAKTYINSSGGIKLYSIEDFKDQNIDLVFLESEVPAYRQFKEKFIPYLSIIDVMMFNSRDEVKNMLKKYKLK
ncbi:MAG TPA: WbqC family protein [Lachnospiraceae bacterium]|nr:WbqC family protein [Lachnospiraceae bacterium]